MSFGNNHYKLVHQSYLDGFDTVLTIGFGNQKRHALYTLKNIRKFVGECVTFDSPGKKSYIDSLYTSELEKMNEGCDSQFQLIKENYNESKGFYLIKDK